MSTNWILISIDKIIDSNFSTKISYYNTLSWTVESLMIGGYLVIKDSSDIVQTSVQNVQLVCPGNSFCRCWLAELPINCRVTNSRYPLHLTFLDKTSVVQERAKCLPAAQGSVDIVEISNINNQNSGFFLFDHHGKPKYEMLEKNNQCIMYYTYF